MNKRENKTKNVKKKKKRIRVAHAQKIMHHMVALRFGPVYAQCCVYQYECTYKSTSQHHILYTHKHKIQFFFVRSLQSCTQYITISINVLFNRRKKQQPLLQCTLNFAFIWCCTVFFLLLSHHMYTYTPSCKAI